MRNDYYSYILQIILTSNLLQLVLYEVVHTMLQVIALLLFAKIPTYLIGLSD